MWGTVDWDLRGRREGDWHISKGRASGHSALGQLEAV